MIRNGHLEFIAGGVGEIKGSVFEKVSSSPASNLFNGRMAYNTGDVTSSDRGVWVYKNTTWERLGFFSELQPIDAALTSISGLSTSADQMLYTTASDTYATTALTSFARSLLDDTTSAAARTTLGLVIGTDVQAFDTELSALAGLVSAADSLPYFTGSGTAALTTLTAFGRSLIDDADAGAGRTTLGLVAGGAGDIWVEKAGDTMTGDLNMGANFVLSTGTPTLDSHLVSKLYVDGLLNGLTWKAEVKATTEAALPAYTASGAGSTKTLTANANASLNSSPIDGVNTFAVNDRILLRNGAAGADNGIYYVFDLGSAGTPWVLKRSADADTITELSTATVTVREGTVNKGVPYTCNNVDTDTLETTAITFVQQNGASSVSAGVGLSKTGNTLDVNLGAGIAQTPTDEVGVDLYDSVNGAIILTTTGTNRSTLASSQLHLLLDGSTLVQASTGLKVADAGITATQLNTSVAGAGLAGGGGTALSVNVDNSTLEIATDTVQVKALGITNSHISASAAVDFSKLAALTAGNTLVGNSSNVASSKKVQFIYSAQNATLSHTVTHNIGQQFVNVTCYNSSNQMIEVDTVTLTDANTVTVTVAVAQAIKVVVEGFPDVAVTSVNNV